MFFFYSAVCLFPLPPFIPMNIIHHSYFFKLLEVHKNMDAACRRTPKCYYMAAIWLHSPLNASPSRTPANGLIVGGTGTGGANERLLKKGNNCGDQTAVRPPADRLRKEPQVQNAQAFCGDVCVSRAVQELAQRERAKIQERRLY